LRRNSSSTCLYKVYKNKSKLTIVDKARLVVTYAELLIILSNKFNTQVIYFLFLLWLFTLNLSNKQTQFNKLFHIYSVPLYFNFPLQKYSIQITSILFLIILSLYHTSRSFFSNTRLLKFWFPLTYSLLCVYTIL
jgi:hypothetical protein